MGKRIEVVPYKPPTKEPIVPIKVEQPLYLFGKPKTEIDGSPEFILAHKRAMKAAQMRRYRAKKAGK